MRCIGRRQFVRGAFGAALTAPSALGLCVRNAGAQGAPSSAESDWPNRPVRFVVPLAPGGGLDFIARLTAEYLSRSLGQQFFVENRTGAGGTIGLEAAAKSPPDGYTVLVTNDNVVSAPHILRLGGEYAKDIVPVILLARQPQAVAVHPSLGVNSVKELVDLAKQRPGLSYATSGVGSNQHVLAEAFAQAAGLKLEHVPYRGAGQAINDFLAGHVRIAFLGPTALLPHHATGAIRIIAQAAAKRSPSLAETPTLTEAGFAGLELESWYGAFVPVGTPRPIITRLNATMDKAMSDAPTRESLLKTATEPVGGAPEQFARVVQDYSEKYARFARELNLKIN